MSTQDLGFGEILRIDDVQHPAILPAEPRRVDHQLIRPSGREDPDLVAWQVVIAAGVGLLDRCRDLGRANRIGAVVRQIPLHIDVSYPENMVVFWISPLSPKT